METFTQIIFPSKPKYVPSLLGSKPLIQLNKPRQIQYWFKDVLDFVTKVKKVFIMVQCPECDFIYEYDEINPETKEYMQKHFRENELYYKVMFSENCTRCGGNKPILI